MTALLEGPKSERTIVLLTPSLRAGAEWLAKDRKVSIGSVLRSSLEVTLLDCQEPTESEDAMQTPAQPQATDTRGTGMGGGIDSEPSDDPPHTELRCSESEPCCDRRNEYNGFASDGPRLFECPKGCICHD